MTTQKITPFLWYSKEAVEYRVARNALLAEEIDLRRHIERVAAQRRALPPGGVVPKDYLFEGEQGPATMQQLFGRHDTLVTYNWMFGPRRQRSCPMCTSLLSALDGETPDILQRVAFAVIARRRSNAWSRSRRRGAGASCACFIGRRHVQPRLRRRRPRR